MGPPPSPRSGAGNMHICKLGVVIREKGRRKLLNAETVLRATKKKVYPNSVGKEVEVEVGGEEVGEMIWGKMRFARKWKKGLEMFRTNMLTNNLTPTICHPNIKLQ